MNRRFLLLAGIGFAVFTFVFLRGGHALGLDTSANEDPVTLASGGVQMIRITPKPQSMRVSVAMACVSAPPVKDSIHERHFFDVYITPGGSATLSSGRGTFPPGTVILKRKYSDSDSAGKVTQIFTGMRKHAAGYDDKNGNWEYFTVSGDGKTVTSDGTLESCIACHQDYASTDFVTRDYEMKPEFSLWERE